MEAEIMALRAEVGQLRDDIRDERARCDLELSSLRQELVGLALQINPPTVH